MNSSREVGEKVTTFGQFGDPRSFYFLINIDFDIKKKMAVKAWSQA